MRRIAAPILVTAAGLAIALGVAEVYGAPPLPRQPPREAIEACEGRAAGDACTVKLPDRTIDGVCRNGPDGNGPLACAPSAPPPTPPPER
jgi:hypothetical protein